MAWWFLPRSRISVRRGRTWTRQLAGCRVGRFRDHNSGGRGSRYGSWTGIGLCSYDVVNTTNDGRCNAGTARTDHADLDASVEIAEVRQYIAPVASRYGAAAVQF